MCLGNICRSPLAHGIMRHIVEGAGQSAHIEIDSAGTGSWHVGDPPDERAVEIAAQYGVDISDLRARQFRANDIEAFDLVLAMDRNNLETIGALVGESASPELFLDYAGMGKHDVPDPYYGGAQGFRDVYQMIEDGCQNILDQLSSSGNASSTR